MSVSIHPRWLAYLEMCKPRVVALMLLTAFVGMALASPTKAHIPVIFFSTIGIALASASAAVVNHLIDRKIDSDMRRTASRPLPQGKIKPLHAWIFSAALGTVGVLILVRYVNLLTAILTFLTMMGYAVIYSVFLKYLTPQNIVIGGIAGAAPPLLGWTAVANHIHPHSLLLVLIIFVWTPPHFWALAIYRAQEYAKVDVPMLPVTHGISFTKVQVLLYTILLFVVSLLPFVTGMSGVFYVVSAIVLGSIFLYYAILLARSQEVVIAMKTFYYSIVYLVLLFSALLLDHLLII